MMKRDMHKANGIWARIAVDNNLKVLETTPFGFIILSSFEIP